MLGEDEQQLVDIVRDQPSAEQLAVEAVDQARRAAVIAVEDRRS